MLHTRAYYITLVELLSEVPLEPLPFLSPLLNPDPGPYAGTCTVVGEGGKGDLNLGGRGPRLGGEIRPDCRS